MSLAPGEPTDWKRVITLVPFVRPDQYQVRYTPNGVVLGDILRDVDGYFVYFAHDHRGGFSESRVLRALADALDELNEPWDQEIQAFFKREQDAETHEAKRDT